MEFGHSIPFSVDIPEGPLLRRIGKSNKKRKVSQRLKNKIKKATREIRDHAKAKAVINVVSLKRKNGFVVLSDKVPLHSKKLSYNLSFCRKAVVFLTTLGYEVDRIIKQNMTSRPHYGYLLDAAASVAAESAAQYVQDYIDVRLRKDEELTIRYSPGYCDWPIDEQSKIFQILPHDEIGVNLSDQYFMSPRKSLSGVMGICPSDSAGTRGNACSICTEFNCSYRRVQHREANE